jgi:hypothetical protein
MYDTSAELLCSSNRTCASMVLYYKHLFPSFKLVISRCIKVMDDQEGCHNILGG